MNIQNIKSSFFNAPNLRMNYVINDKFNNSADNFCLFLEPSGDSVSFSINKKGMETKPVMQETVKDVLEQNEARRGRHFSNAEKSMIIQEARNFKSEVQTSSILKELLNLEFADEDTIIDADTIINFFQIMNGATAPQIKATFRVLDGFALFEPDDFYTLVLSYLEEQPELIKHFGDFEEKYKNLPEKDKNKLLFDVFMALSFEGINTAQFFPQVADIFANNKQNDVINDIILFSAESLNEELLKNVMNSLTSERIQQINEETKNLKDSESKSEYVDNYIEQFTK